MMPTFDGARRKKVDSRDAGCERGKGGTRISKGHKPKEKSSTEETKWQLRESRILRRGSDNGCRTGLLSARREQRHRHIKRRLEHRCKPCDGL